MADVSNSKTGQPHHATWKLAVTCGVFTRPIAGLLAYLSVSALRLRRHSQGAQATLHFSGQAECVQVLRQSPRQVTVVWSCFEPQSYLHRCPQVGTTARQGWEACFLRSIPRDWQSPQRAAQVFGQQVRSRLQVSLHLTPARSSSPTEHATIAECSHIGSFLGTKVLQLTASRFSIW